jgi:hypothetical protein
MNYIIKIALSSLIIIIASVLGHYKPLYYLIGGTFLVPLSLSYINLIRIKSKDVGAFITLTSIMLTDYLFRLYGGGTHDQVGKTLCDISLAIALLIALIFIIYYKIKEYKQKMGTQSMDVILIIVQIIGYVTIPILFYLLFNNF